MLNQIAAYLQVSTSQIVRCDEWAKVYFVIVAGKRPTFISKKVVTMESITKEQAIALNTSYSEDCFNRYWTEETSLLAAELATQGVSSMTAPDNWLEDNFPAYKKCDHLKARQSAMVLEVAFTLVQKAK